MEKKMLGIIGIAVILLAAITVLAVNTYQKPAFSNKEEELFTIRAPVRPALVMAFEFADELGYLKEAGIRLEHTGDVSGGPEAIMSVEQGSNDVGTSAAWTALINAKAKGVNIKVVLSGGGVSPETNSEWLVLNDSGIKTANDLKSKKIAVNTLGAHYEYTTRAYLNQQGASQDIQMIVLPYPNQIQALRQRQIDVAALNSPFKDKLKEEGGVRTLFTDYDVLGRKSTGGYFFREKFIKEHPDIVKKFVSATVKAIDWVDAHPKEAVEIYERILKKRNQNPDLAKYWKGWGISDNGIIHDEDIQLWIDAMVAGEKLKTGEFKPSNLYTNEFNPYYKK